jgi:hypothetical protein
VKSGIDSFFVELGGTDRNGFEQEEAGMKKLLFVLPLAVLLLTLTIGNAAARYDYEDPSLCVAGKWLLVDAASRAGVTVFVPEDTPYGDQKAGGCKTAGPDVPLVRTVKERGGGHTMRVQVDGKLASTPQVIVSYGDKTFTKENKGRGTFEFKFDLPAAHN